MWSRWALQECSFDGSALTHSPINEQFKGMTYILSPARIRIWEAQFLSGQYVSVKKYRTLSRYFACKSEKGLRRFG